MPASAIAALPRSHLAGPFAGASVLGAQAQGMGPSNARAQQAARDAKEKPPKADEQAYKNALKSVPRAAEYRIRARQHAQRQFQ